MRKTIISLAILALAAPVMPMAQAQEAEDVARAVFGFMKSEREAQRREDEERRMQQAIAEAKAQREAEELQRQQEHDAFMAAIEAEQERKRLEREQAAQEAERQRILRDQMRIEAEAAAAQERKLEQMQLEIQLAEARRQAAEAEQAAIAARQAEAARIKPAAGAATPVQRGTNYNVSEDAFWSSARTFGIPTDTPGNRYKFVKRNMSNGKTLVHTRRYSPKSSGYYYAKRVVNCSDMTYSMLREADDWSSFKSRADNASKYMELFPQSISWYLAQEACG